MEENQKLNKIAVFFFVVVLITTGVLLFYFISIQKKLSVNSPTPLPTTTPILTSINERFVAGAEKITNRNSNIAFYALQSVLVGVPVYDPIKCSYSGEFYLLGDRAKNMIKYKFDCTDNLYSVGIFDKNFNSNSTWNSIDKDDFLKLAKNGAKVQIRGNFYLDDEGKIKTSEYDEIFRSINDSKGTKINISDNSVFDVAAIGFTNE